MIITIYRCHCIESQNSLLANKIIYSTIMSENESFSRVENKNIRCTFCLKGTRRPLVAMVNLRIVIFDTTTLPFKTSSIHQKSYTSQRLVRHQTNQIGDV